MTPVTRAFLRAAADGDVSLIRGLLAQGTDVDATNKAGQTALMLAAAFKRTDIVSLLLTSGADVEARDELGLTVFEWAGESSDIIELLTHEPSSPEPEPAPMEVLPEPEMPPEITTAIPVVHLNRLVVKREEVRGVPSNESRELKGLAAAILRDHAPKSNTISPHTTSPPDPPREVFVDDQPTPVYQFVEPRNGSTASEQFVGRINDSTPSDHFDEPINASTATDQFDEPINASIASEQFDEPINASIAYDQFDEPINASTPSDHFVEPINASIASDQFDEPINASTASDQFDDITFGGMQTEINDDTAAPSTRPLSRSRIFDLDPSQEFPKPISKVEVAVPSFSSPSTSRSGVVVWTLVIVVLAAGGFGGYRLATYILAGRTTSAASPATTTTTPPTQPAPVALKKSAPKVGGELVGAELHLPDAEYPSDATQSATGTVTVQVRVSKKGMVVSAKAINGDESLKAAAENAAKRSAFSPEKLQDKSAVMDGTITYHFIPPQQLGTQSTGPSTGDNATGVSIRTGGPLAGAELKLKEPSESSAKGVTGTVTLVVRVSRGGSVISWRPLDGDSRLRSLAVNAAKLSTFSPDKLPGTGEVVGTITYTFH